MYLLILARTSSEHPERNKVVTTAAISDDPEKIEVALKTISGLLRLVSHDPKQVRGLTDALCDLVVHYRVHAHLKALGMHGRPVPPLVDAMSKEHRMHLLLRVADHFVADTPDEFIRWLHEEAQRPVPGGLSVVR